MVFFWTMNIHTKLNVYMWMYLSRTVFIIFVKSKKCGQNKAESSCHSPQPSGPHPSSPRYTDTRNYTHAIHANTHACTQSHQMPNSHCPRDNLQNLLSVNKQNPNLQQTKKTDANMDFCSQWMSSPLISRAARHLMSFVMDANYAYQFIPTSSQYFTNDPGCRKKMLWAKPWKLLTVDCLLLFFFHRFNIVP